MQILEHILKKSKAGILATSWQPCEFGNQLAISWQSVGNPCEFRKPHCQIRKPHALFICLTQKLQNLSENSHCQFRKPHCQLRKPLCQIRKPLCQIRKPHCQIRNLAKFANTLRNSQRLRTRCEVFAKFSIFTHCFALRFCFAHNFFIRTPF